MTRVEIQDISIRYGTEWVVNDASLEIDPGEIFFLLGPSGCGKTTLLRTIAGLKRPAMGEILFNGRPMNVVPTHERNVGFVFQNYALWPHMNVYENISYGLITRGVSKDEIRARITPIMSMLGIDGLENRAPGELSGGQQQRVAVARAVVIEPDVLLMDEPLSNLDARLRAEMRRDLKDVIRRLGLTTIYVTHDQHEALSMGDRIALMQDGRIEQIGPPKELYVYPETEFAATFIGEANVLEATATGRTDLGFNAKTAAGVIEVARGGQHKRGTDVRLIIRPEDIEIGSGLQRDNIMGGRVADIEFGGGFDEVLVELRAGVMLRGIRKVAIGDPLKLGQTVEIGFDAEAVKPFLVPSEIEDNEDVVDEANNEQVMPKDNPDTESNDTTEDSDAASNDKDEDVK